MRYIVLLVVTGWFACCLSSVDAQQKKKDTSDIDKLAKNLRSPNPNVRFKAVQKLGQLEGADKEQVVTLLCDAVLDPVPRISNTALQFLENIHPELYKHIVVIMRDNKSVNRSQAIEALGKMGTKARPATRIMHSVIYKYIYAGDHSEIYREVSRSFYALRQMEAYDLETLNFMRDIVINDRVQKQPEKEKFIYPKIYPEIYPKIRLLALEHLVAWAGDDPLRRKQLIPLLRVGLGQSEGALLMRSIEISGAYGELAADLLPLLKEHKLSSEASVREAASKAVEKIEKR